MQHIIIIGYFFINTISRQRLSSGQTSLIVFIIIIIIFFLPSCSLGEIFICLLREREREQCSVAAILENFTNQKNIQQKYKHRIWKKKTIHTKGETEHMKYEQHTKCLFSNTATTSKYNTPKAYENNDDDRAASKQLLQQRRHHITTISANADMTKNSQENLKLTTTTQAFTPKTTTTWHECRGGKYLRTPPPIVTIKSEQTKQRRHKNGIARYTQFKDEIRLFLEYIIIPFP